MKKFIGLLLVVLATVIVIADGIAGIRGYYAYEASIGAHWQLADKSSSIPAKAAHVDNFVAALESQGLAGKHDALIYPNVNNSFDHNLMALKTLQARLHEISAMDVRSFEYQTAIQQITAQEQGEAEAMLLTFEGVWWKNRNLFMWDWIFVLNIMVVTTFYCTAIGFFIYDDL